MTQIEEARFVNKVVIDGNSLTLNDVVNVSRKNFIVELSPHSEKNIIDSRNLVEQYIREGRVVYGITTGFGKFSDVVISRDDATVLQENLIVSHACGVGEQFSEEIVRGMMLLRANALAKGFSGIRPLVVNTLLQMLNKKVHPVIFQKGSLGASGDLAPLSHMVLVMIGKGEANYNGIRMPGEKAMELAQIETIKLAEKEGLALINGTQAMTSVAAMAVYDAVTLIKSADIISAMTVEALKGITDAYHPTVNELRPHPGQKICGQNMCKILAGSGLTTEQGEVRVQDAYSIRCIPQIHGASKDAVSYVKNVVEIELNSVTDNPLILTEEKKVISAGNFHGQPVALAMDFLCIAMSEIANVSERRIERLVNYQLNDLPAFLTAKGGLNSGFMIAQYVAASLVSENKVLSHPASVDSIPSSANQEDHVSMGTIAARKARSIIENVTSVLGIEYLASAQALYLRGDCKLSKSAGVAIDLIRQYIPPLDEDRVMYHDINTASDIVSSGKLLNVVEDAIGNLL
jgi:histidine ammonia-lyase